MAGRYEYKVEEIREGMIGGKMSGDKLEKVLNARAREGWQLRAITSVEVKGRIGTGGRGGRPGHLRATGRMSGAADQRPVGFGGDRTAGSARG